MSDNYCLVCGASLALNVNECPICGYGESLFEYDGSQYKGIQLNEDILTDLNDDFYPEYDPFYNG